MNLPKSGKIIHLLQYKSNPATGQVGLCKGRGTRSHRQLTFPTSLRNVQEISVEEILQVSASAITRI